jgi:hypothetical protein
VRYTANTFAEDLMFTQTKDRQNWQTRYVVQNPYGGDIAQCSAKVGAMDCAAMCRPRVAQLVNAQLINANGEQRDGSKDALALQRECVAACALSKRQGLQAAIDYYQQHLPQRIAREKQTLAQLTGWALSDIDAMPDARKYSATNGPGRELEQAAAVHSGLKPWWQKLFGGLGAK